MSELVPQRKRSNRRIQKIFIAMLTIANAKRSGHQIAENLAHPYKKRGLIERLNAVRSHPKECRSAAVAPTMKIGSLRHGEDGLLLRTLRIGLLKPKQPRTTKRHSSDFRS